MALTPQAFVQKWANTTLNERQSYQLHFIDVCHLLNFETPQPSGKTATGKEFIFERTVKEKDGKTGYADVFLQGCFAMEYKAPDRYKTLTEAQEQLRRYHQRLQNPPLLIVTDIKNWIIETNFTNRENYELKFTNEDLLDDKIRGKLVDAFKNPDRLDPNRDVAQVTKEAAVSFQEIVKNMRSEFVGASTETVAHFLTKLVFCLFAEDIGLLPTHDGYGIFSYIIDRTVHDDSYDKFKDYVGRLFHAMNDGTEIFMEDIPYFNGSLFSDVDVIGLGRNARVKLHDASLLNWEYVEPTIFGTLFERALDPAERVPLGAHYTSSADIQLIVEPVLMQPLRREWAQIQAQAQTVRTRYDSATTGRNRADAITELTTLRDTMRHKLSTVKVLDPACGSGNFLYIALQSLLDLEQEVITYPAWQEIPEIPLVEPAVHPTQMYGIEKNAIAHALANIVVWIGYLQWKLRNGYRTITRPILQDTNTNIIHKDAILEYVGAHGNAPDTNDTNTPKHDASVGTASMPSDMNEPHTENADATIKVPLHSAATPTATAADQNVSRRGTDMGRDLRVVRY
jgi:hypothetical protein